MSDPFVAPLAPRQTPAADAGTGSTNEQLLKLVSSPFQASLQTNAFWASLGISLGISVLLAAVFSLVRPRHRLVYAPKTKHADEKHAPPPMGNGVFSWIVPVAKAKESMLMDKIGMDAVVFLRFTRMLRNIFIALSAIGICIMIPVNVSKGNKFISEGGSGFAIMTPLYVFDHGALWAQVVVAWGSNIIIAYFLWHNYRRIHKLRRSYLESPEYQTSLHARTLLIRDIPSELRSEEGIVRITDDVNPIGVTPKITLGRDVKILPDLIEEHEDNVRSLESVLAKYMKNPDRLPPNRPTMHAPNRHKGKSADGKVDAIDYLTDRIRELEVEIGQIRESVDKRGVMSYGFASWDQISQAHSIAFAARKKNIHGAKVQLATRPNDLIWKNLPLGKAARKSLRFINVIWITVLTVLWMPLNAGIAIFLSNLSNLGSVWKGFQQQLEAHKTGWAIVQGIAAPALTSLVYLVLPIIFRRLQIRAGDVTKTQREQHVLRNLYMFFTLNNLLVFSIFSAIWQYITVVIENNRGGTDTWEALKKADLFLTVTTALCQISPFWVTWLLQRNLGAAIDLAQLWKLTLVWFERTFMAPTPRQNIEWTAPPAFDYAEYYNYFLFYATVALCFSTLQPIVLLVTAIYFSFDAVLKKYLLMYVFITKTESGGQFWKTLFNRMVFATMLSDVVIAVVVIARGTWEMVGALAPLLLIMGGFKYYCAKTFDTDIQFYTHNGLYDQEHLAATVNHDHDHKRPRADKISFRFGHPALSKPLMTPMVHAKARHVLADIYRGRLASESDPTGATFADIAMQPMTPGGGPKPNGAPHQPSVSAGPNPAPFEYVSEAQQDFAYYKNRPDFREDGNYHSSRPETPRSFMSTTKAGALYSPVSSREGSPAPDSKRAHVQVKRKGVDPTHVHPAFLPRTQGTETESPTADLGMRHGTYTDPYDDRTNLLRDVGDVNLATPSGEFMSMDRWRTGETPTPGTGGGEGSVKIGGYDYFRGHR